jgi:hypothetical protein
MLKKLRLRLQRRSQGIIVSLKETKRLRDLLLSLSLYLWRDE